VVNIGTDGEGNYMQEFFNQVGKFIKIFLAEIDRLARPLGFFEKIGLFRDTA